MKKLVVALCYVLCLGTLLTGCKNNDKETKKEKSEVYSIEYTVKEINDENDENIFDVHVNKPIFSSREKYDFAREIIEPEYEKYLKYMNDEVAPIAIENIKIMKENGVDFDEDDVKAIRQFEVKKYGNEELIKKNKENDKTGILSFVISDEEYIGGAHGSASKKSIIIDFDNEKRIKLDDVFNCSKEEYIKVLHDKIRMKIEEEINLKTNEKEVAIRQINYFEEYEKGIDDSFSDDYFYLDGDKIVFIYNPYSIAPYSEGIIEKAIPLSDLKDILNPDFI